MTPDRWKDVERLYHSARAEAPEARPAFLAKACGGDAKPAVGTSTASR